MIVIYGNDFRKGDFSEIDTLISDLLRLIFHVTILNVWCYTFNRHFPSIKSDLND